jgi:hypothetical protein
MVALLVEAGALCRERGIQLFVVFVPAKFRVYRDLCEFADGSPCPQWPTDDLSGSLRTALAESSPEIAFLDLTPRFRALAAAGALLYLPDDPHWTAAGHRAAASAIAAALRPRDPAADRVATTSRQPR